MLTCFSFSLEAHARITRSRVWRAPLAAPRAAAPRAPCPGATGWTAPSPPTAPAPARRQHIGSPGERPPGRPRGLPGSGLPGSTAQKAVDEQRRMGQLVAVPAVPPPLPCLSLYHAGQLQAAARRASGGQGVQSVQKWQRFQAWAAARTVSLSDNNAPYTRERRLLQGPCARRREEPGTRHSPTMRSSAGRCHRVKAGVSQTMSGHAP